MKIEIDTQRDSKEELGHLAYMLQAIAENRRIRNRTENIKERLREERRQRSTTRNIFEDPAPTTGFMNIFGNTNDNTNTQANTQMNNMLNTNNSPIETAQEGNIQNSQTGDLFSIFGATQQTQERTTTQKEDLGIPGLNLYGNRNNEEKDDESNILNDTRIVPY